MRGGFARTAIATPYALIVALLLLLSGCSLFRPAPPPEQEAPVAASEPEMASEPDVATPPEAASEPEEEENEAKHTPRKPRPAPVRRRRPAPPPPPPPPPPPMPAPAPIISTRAIEHGSFRTLLDAEVQRPDGKVVGRAVDLIAGPDGKPADIVVNLQGFMGVGDRKANFPWSTVRVSTRAKTPAITLVLGPGQQPAPDRPKATGAPPAGPADATPTRLPMLDASIERPNGAKVGRVVDVLLDGEADPLAIVLDVSGTLQKRRTIAADWSALRFVAKDNTLHGLLDMTDQQIDASPPYENDQPIRAVTPLAAAPASSVPARGVK
ncbi:PRC-barrel domain-containing protein [Paraburkholderia caballeronis]|uniref:PRC-barrel domain-containing protein n=1 Tax=Paraburkholderia caballeronis TaxID=416943 RepID=UPI001066E97E|nr:PRC-barrel domain-containing protein [Paraburkholderia caballeronis]TDV09535.1 PRC-barrel domain protein [Paraburkholderia caballeronis]TDV13806.1 PRC-barrel domain protein [Paraburkholderia caballeronis]TDV22988.1 PRC-barrel domain protein [Paraburkholderia caballeronis]